MIKKLMTAASVAALLTGAASAQLKLEATGAGPTIDPASVIAEEVDFTALNATAAGVGSVELEIVTQGTIPPGQNLFLTIEATNATFATGLNGAEFTDGTTGAVVNTGGASGGSSVRYLITSNTGNDGSSSGNGADRVQLLLPFNMTSCGDVTFSVTEFETESAGTDIEGGSASLTTSGGGAPFALEPLLTCEDAYQATLAVDADDTTLDFNTDFEQFVVAAPDTATTAILGDFTLNVDTSIDIDLNGTAAAPAHILGFDADVDFADDTNIATGEAIPGVGALFTVAATATAANEVALSSTTAAASVADDGTFEIVISGASGDPVSPQTVSVSDATLTLDDTTFSLLATDDFLAADVEDLKLNGQYFGPFDWVSDSTKLVNTIFRVTGFDGVDDIPAQFVVQNSRNGAAFNGVYPFTILASDVQGSEIRLNSAAIEAEAGLFGTADVSIVFSSSLDLDVDRLLAGPSNAVVVPFGDGANDSGLGTPYGSTAPTTDNDDAGNF